MVTRPTRCCFRLAPHCASCSTHPNTAKLPAMGWGIGGLIGGVVADYLGRKRTMMLAILAYSIMTGLSAFAWDWVSFVALRFLVGVAIGSEWVIGTSIVSELWPDRARGRGVGLMQSGFGIGFFLASFAWRFVGAVGPDAWRCSSSASCPP
jgi:MFS family permease